MATPPQLPRFELATAPLDEGTCLLEASAGTGKTYTITGILVRMVLEGTVERIEQALVVTFTVAAADELKNRLREGLQRALAVCLGGDDPDPFYQGLREHGARGAARLRRAIDEFDQAAVTTIHGFCKRLLDDSAFESDEPFDLEFTVDEVPLWQSAAADALRMLHGIDSPMLGSLLHDSGMTPDTLVALYRSWQRHPDVALDPASPHLDVHVDNLRAAVRGAAGHWDDAVREELVSMPWLKQGRPTQGPLEPFFERFGEQLRLQPERQLRLLRSLNPDDLARRLRANANRSFRHAFLQGCGEVFEQWRHADRHLRSTLLQHMHARLLRHKRERAVLTFDDLLQRAHRALHEPGRAERVLEALRERHRVALIDEFQDTDERQYEILATAFEHRPLFLVGDPKQSIYGFRGADLDTYLMAADDALQQSTLSTNFRSSRALVRAVNDVFGKNLAFVEPRVRMPKVSAKAGPHDLEIDGDGDPAHALHFRLLPAESTYQNGKLKPWGVEDGRRRIAEDVADEIHRLLHGDARLDDQPLLPRHIAVLTRLNAEAVQVQEQLRELGIVSVIGKAGDVFETDELVELERLLLAIHRPNDLQRARAAMATRLWGLDALQLHALDRDEPAFEQSLGLLEKWRQLWLHRGFVVMKEAVLRDLDAEARMLQRGDGERRLTNLEQLCEMLHQAEHDHRLSPEGLLHWLQHERDHKDEIDYQRRELRLESDEDAVQILTMHGSKGLQYEVVFCPFLWGGRPAPKTNVTVETSGRDGDDGPMRELRFEVDEDDPGWLALEADRLAEDVRLAYVALTRAKRRCYVHWGAIGSNLGGYWCSALAWLCNPHPVETDKAGWQRAWALRYRDQVTDLEGDLRRLAARSHGSIEVRTIPPTRPPRGPAAVTTSEDPTRAPRRRSGRARTLPYRAPRVVHSFSSLVAGGSSGDDAHDVHDPARIDDGAAPGPGDGIFGFARGAEAGQCLHTILEHVALDDLGSDAARELVRTTLRQFGLLDPAAHPGDIDPVEVVLQNLADLAASRMRASGATIGAVCGGPRLCEWQFTLPMPVQPDLAGLADRFAASACDVARGYAERLRGLPTQRFAGYLTGFVDLVAAHDDRYWIVDWKSNHLGDSVAHYDQAALHRSMREHDYVLQYHLYVLAWHRHLQARLDGYDYDRDFGGVLYAFLRGAEPGADSGMFCVRPPRALVESLDDWAEGVAP